MFKKALTESGKRILKAIKKLSTRSRAVRKSQKKKKNYTNEVTCELTPAAVPGWTQTYLEPENASLSWSLHSLDTKSIDTYVTYVTESIEECNSICCYCTEHENQRNENRENEMIT